MKKIPVLLFIVALCIPLVAQTKTAKTPKGATTDPQAFIQSVWEDFKTKNATAFGAALPSNALSADSRGLLTKDQVMADLKNCTMNSYSLSDFKQEAAGKDALLVTYRAKVDAGCGDQKAPQEVICGDVLVKQGGAWKSLWHQETPITQK
jgi:hypothetical protein